MSFKTTLIPRKVAGVSTAFKVFYVMQDNERARFFVMRGQRVWFTRSYANVHEGMTQLPMDFRTFQEGTRAA